MWLWHHPQSNKVTTILVSHHFSYRGFMRGACKQSKRNHQDSKACVFNVYISLSFCIHFGSLFLNFLFKWLVSFQYTETNLCSISSIFAHKHCNTTSKQKSFEWRQISKSLSFSSQFPWSSHLFYKWIIPLARHCLILNYLKTIWTIRR